MKFGGSSFKDSKTISNIFEIIKTRIHKKPVIVCSAIPGITDMLFMLGTESVFGNKVKVKLILDSIIENIFPVLVFISLSIIKVLSFLTVTFSTESNLINVSGFLSPQDVNKKDTIKTLAITFFMKFYFLILGNLNY